MAPPNCYYETFLASLPIAIGSIHLVILFGMPQQSHKSADFLLRGSSENFDITEKKTNTALFG